MQQRCLHIKLQPPAFSSLHRELHQLLPKEGRHLLQKPAPCAGTPGRPQRGEGQDQSLLPRFVWHKNPATGSCFQGDLRGSGAAAAASLRPGPGEVQPGPQPPVRSRALPARGWGRAVAPGTAPPPSLTRRKTRGPFLLLNVNRPLNLRHLGAAACAHQPPHAAAGNSEAGPGPPSPALRGRAAGPPPQRCRRPPLTDRPRGGRAHREAAAGRNLRSARGPGRTGPGSEAALGPRGRRRAGNGNRRVSPAPAAPLPPLPRAAPRPAPPTDPRGAANQSQAPPAPWANERSERVPAQRHRPPGHALLVARKPIP